MNCVSRHFQAFGYYFLLQTSSNKTAWSTLQRREPLHNADRKDEEKRVRVQLNALYIIVQKVEGVWYFDDVFAFYEYLCGDTEKGTITTLVALYVSLVYVTQRRQIIFNM